MKIKSEFKREDYQDLNSQNQIDIEKSLSEILAREIDMEILTNFLIVPIKEEYQILVRDNKINSLLGDNIDKEDIDLWKQACVEKLGEDINPDLIDRIIKRFKDGDIELD